MAYNKVNRNDLCPCGKGMKYKKCCEGKLDWNEIYKKNDDVLISKNLSLKGKNIAFIYKIIESLQLDPKDYFDNKKFKNAITPDVIRKLHEYIKIIWPDANDLDRIISENNDSNSALYLGYYEPASIIRGINRHSLYSEKIFVIDPFIDPRTIKEEFNPIINPEKHLENTIQDIRTWINLYPWINAGIVNIIRNPCDFNYPLTLECFDKSEKRNNEYPELKEIIKIIPTEIKKDLEQWHLLLQPDIKIIQDLKNVGINYSDNDILKTINKIRADHPYFVSLEHSKYGKERLFAYKGGANFDMAKLIASALNSHLITDIEYRWKEITIEHKSLNIKQNHWSSFSKAFQSIDFSFLNNVKVEDALEIRKENYLDNLRTFLSKIWINCTQENMFDEKSIFLLEEELKHHINESEIEWNEIKRKYFKKIGIGSAVTIGASEAIASGSAVFMIGSLLINGLTNLGISWLEKKNFPKKYPASFFLKLKDKK